MGERRRFTRDRELLVKQKEETGGIRQAGGDTSESGPVRKGRSAKNRNGNERTESERKNQTSVLQEASCQLYIWLAGDLGIRFYTNSELRQLELCLELYSLVSMKNQVLT